jgi:hypothetical protein
MTTGEAVLDETRVHRDLFARVLLSEVERIAEPLRELDERQRAAIIVLVGAAQLVTAYERSLHHPDGDIGRDFDAILSRLHAAGARLLGGLRPAGLADSVAYAWTLARCAQQDEDTGNRAARAAAAEIVCAMSHLDGFMEAVRRLRLSSR